MEIVMDGRKLEEMTRGLKPEALLAINAPISFSGVPDGLYRLLDGRRVQRFLNFGSPAPGFILDAGETLAFKPLPRWIE